MDSIYQDSIDRGDIATALKLLEEKASSSGYTIKVFHATQSDSGLIESNVFNTAGLSAHFGDKDAAREREKNLLDFDKVVGGSRTSRSYDIITFLIKIENPLTMPDLASLDQSTGNPLEEEIERFNGLPDDERASRERTGDVPYQRYWESEYDFSMTIHEMGIIDSETFWEVQYNKDRAVEEVKKEGYDGIQYINEVENAGSIVKINQINRI